MAISMKSKIIRSSDPIAEPVDDELVMADIDAGKYYGLNNIARAIWQNLETARSQIFTDKYFATSIPEPFVQLLESRGWGDKIKIFWQRVFLPKVVIANNYSVPIDSLRIYGCYLRRFYDVLRRHGRTFKKFQKNDPAVKSLADRKKLIADWMD